MKDGKVIEDWVDAEEIRHLAEKLITPPKGQVAASDDPAYGDGFEGFVDLPAVKAEPAAALGTPAAPRPMVEQPREPLPGPKSSVATEAPVQVNPFAKASSKESGSKPVVTSPFRAAPPREVVERQPSPIPSPAPAKESTVDTFVEWVKREIPLEAILICGRGGRMLFDDLRQAKLISVARLLAGAAHRKGGGPMKAMVIKRGEKQVLQVIPFRKGSDDFFAALLLPRPLTDSGVMAFEKALGKALG